MNNRVLVSLFSLVVIASGTIVAIKFAQGYRPTRQGSIAGTGLLNANSFPTGASLYMNGELTSATDTTLNLPPATYTVSIRKDGYSPWEKQVVIEKELVTQTNAVLFPITPSLTPLTFTGATIIHPSPDGQRIAYVSASSSATKKNGLYVLDLTDSPLALSRGPRQVASSEAGIDFATADILWSPGSDKLLVSSATKHLLLDAGRLNELGKMDDISNTLPALFREWEEELYQKQRDQLLQFPNEIVKIATQSASHAFVSPDREKLLYIASSSAVIPDHLIPPVPAASTQQEHRKIEAGNVYVYDLREDRNFLISSDKPARPTTKPSPTPSNKAVRPSPLPTPQNNPQLLSDIALPLRTLQASPSAFLKLYVRGDIQQTGENFERYYSPLYSNAPQWLPDSRHVILQGENGISIIGYDGTNKTQVYAGPFAANFIYPWPNGSKLLILTNLNQSGSAPLNLYAVGLR